MKKQQIMELTASERQLIRLIRSMDEGELRIVMKEYRPIWAEQIFKNKEDDALTELTEEPRFGE